MMVAASFSIIIDYCEHNAESLNASLMKTVKKYDSCLNPSYKGNDTIISLAPEMGSVLKKLNSQNDFREFVLHYDTLLAEALASKEAILYFIDNLDRIFSLFYTPSDEDLILLKLNAQATGRGKFQVGDFEFLLQCGDHGAIREVGYFHELSKSQPIRAIFYLISLSDLYQHLAEHVGDRNCLEMFCLDVNSQFLELSEIPIFLMFTKNDVFDSIFQPSKLRYAEFRGNTANEARDFFKQMCFKGLYKAHHQVSVHFLSSLDAESCKKFLLQVYEWIGNPKPRDAASFSSLGYWLKRQKRYEESLKAFDKSIDLDKDNSFAHTGKGKVLMELGKLKEASQEFSNSAAIDSNYADTYNFQAKILNELGRHNEAVLAFEMGQKIDPRYPLDFSIQARCLNQVGRFDDAISSSKDAMLNNPWDFDASVQLLEALISLFKFQEVLDICKNMTSSDSENAASYYYKGKVLRLLGKPSEALEAYRTAASLDHRIFNTQEMLWVNHQRALELYRNSVFHECLQVSRLNLELYPNHIFSLELMVKCAIELDDFSLLWKFGALLKAHFYSGTWSGEIAATDKPMIEKTLTRYSKLYKMKFAS
jgi:tetratricopeptide (TPR) repeat protein